MRLRIHLLGDPSIAFDGEPWRFSAPPKALPLLALLALRGEPVTRATLAARLWPDDSDADARANLRRHLHALVKALPAEGGIEWIHTHGQNVAWNAHAPAVVDAVEFETLVADPATYERAVELYRGDLLSASFDEAILAERERLRSLQLHALFELAQQARLNRDYGTAVARAEAILSVDEWREDALRLVMSARYAMGDRSGALAAFERFARRLRVDLHAEPMFETSALRDAIVNDSLPADDGAVPVQMRRGRPLVGRDALLAELLQHWLRAANGSGSTVFLAGEPGIGKSRLAQELLATIETQGGRGVIGRTSQPEAFAYQPLVEALRHIVPFIKREAAHDRWLGTLAPLVPEVRRLYNGIGEPAALEAERGHMRLQDAIVRAIETLARVRPLAIVLEDLHFANADTFEMIRFVSERLSGIPAMLILTYRNTETHGDSPVRVLRRELQRTSRASHVSLPRLSEEDVARIIELAAAGAPPELATRVFSLSEGNPLFTWQLLHQFNERPGELDVSAAIASVADAIRTRISLLSPDVRAVTDVAATIGDTFTVEEIASIGGWDESVVFDALATLLERQLVAERAGNAFEYAFTHALIGNAIYDATPAAARAMRHRRAADVLEQTRAGHGRGYALVAQHWERAGEPARARAAYLQGARAALAAYARADAQQLAQRVLDAGGNDDGRFTALQIIVASTDKAGDVATAERAVRELAELSTLLGPQAQYDALVTQIRFHEYHSQRDAQAVAIDRLATLAREHNEAHWSTEATLRRAALVMQRGGTAEGERILRAEIGSVECIGDAKARYRYHSLLAQSLIRQGRYEEGLEELQAFRAFLDAFPNLDGESLYTYSELKYAWLLEDATYIQRVASRFVELAHARGDLIDEASGRIDLAYTLHQLHDTAGARVEFERVLELFARCHSWQGWVNTRINYGVMEREVGHLDRALAYWTEGRAKGLELGVRFAVAVADTNFAEVEITRRNYEQALAHARDARERIKETGESRLLGETDLMMGLALCGTGDMREGLLRIHRSLENSRQLKQSRSLASHLTLVLETMLHLERNDLVDATARELHELFDSDPHDHQHPGRICAVLAEAARRAGDDERARELTTRAREVLQARLEAFTQAEDREAFITMNEHIFSEAAV